MNIAGDGVNNLQDPHPRAVLLGQQQRLRIVPIQPVGNRQRLAERFTIISNQRWHQANRIQPPVLQRVLLTDADIDAHALVVDAFQRQRDAHAVGG